MDDAAQQRRWIQMNSKPEGAIDDQRHRHLLPEAFCEWCGEVDMLGRHENGCRLGLGPDELDEVDYECPRCFRVAPWTDGIENVPEFWCQTCGAETPLNDCRVVPR
jgi:hypothetical protein